MADLLPPLRPIPIKERLSVLYIERGQLDVLDGAFVVVDVTGVRTHIPVGGVADQYLATGRAGRRPSLANFGRYLPAKRELRRGEQLAIGQAQRLLALLNGLKIARLGFTHDFQGARCLFADGTCRDTL